MARRRLPPPSDLLKAAHEFLYERGNASRADAAKTKARDLLKGWLTMKDANGKYVNGRVDEHGHRYYDFEQPLTIGDEVYTGIQAQRKTTGSIDLAATEDLLREKGGQDLYDLVFKREVVRVFNQDELFVLHQKGVITDDELDALETEDESYSLCPAKS